jgi:hypothetical protein
MKTTIKDKLKSSYQGILDYFSWLLYSDRHKSPIYETDLDVEDIEIKAVVGESQIKDVPVENFELFEDVKHTPPKNDIILTKKQALVLELIPNGEWVSSTFVGNAYCDKVYAADTKEGRSQYSSKTLNELVNLGLVEKNNKRQYKKR